MLVDFDFPQDFSNARIYRVDVGRLVAEVGDELPVAPLFERDRTADACFDLQRPMDTSRLRVQNVYVALSRGHVHAAAGHHGLRACRGRAWKSKRPFQRQSWQVVGFQSGRLRRLKPRVRDAVAPPIPCRPGQRVRSRSRCGAAECRLRYRAAGIGSQRFSGQVFGQCAALRAAPLRGPRSHRASLERFENLFRAHPPHYVAAGCLRIRSGSFMARGAVGPEESLTRHLGRHRVRILRRWSRPAASGC